MKSLILYENGAHRWIVLGRDEKKRSDIIDTNQFAVLTDDGVCLLDPGGIEIFPTVLSELTRYVDPEEVKVLFSSHQDPDIISSLSMWLDICPDARVYTSWLWTGFLSHFCMGEPVTMEALPDEGGRIPVGKSAVRLEAVPAHYCHSSGNFSVWDPKARILFSGDIGAALLPDHEANLFVESFTDHISTMEAFHRRWMPSREALHDWIRRVRELDPQMICPQHGSIFRGENVGLFLDWLESLEVGCAIEQTVAS
ncbi:MAG: MBL fold metallo-hydrolase [Planctomycetota bacterium]